MSQVPEYAQCDVTLSRGVVNTLKAEPTPSSTYDPISVTYYSGTVWPAVAPSIVGLCLYAAVLLCWIIWRSVKNCGCCRRRSRAEEAWGQGLVYEVSGEGGMVPLPPQGVDSGKEKQGSGLNASSKVKTDIVASAGGNGLPPVGYSVASGRPSVGQVRRQLLVLTGAVVMGLGVIACSIYGLTTVRPAIVTDSVAVINDSGRGFAVDVLRVVEEAVRYVFGSMQLFCRVACGMRVHVRLFDVRYTVPLPSPTHSRVATRACSVGYALDGTLTSIDNDLGDGGLRSVLINMIDSDNVVERTVASIQGELRVLLGDAEDAIISAEDAVLGSIDDAIEDFEPTAQQYNTYRLIGMYVLYGLVIFLVLTVVTMALARWPFYHSVSLFLFMVIMMVTCAVMVAHTFGVKVAGDSCDNLETYLLNEVLDGQARDVVQFYLSEGRDTSTFSDVYDMANVAFDVDVREILSVVEMAKQSVDQAIVDNGLQGAALAGLLQEELDTARAQADEITRLVRSAIDMVQPEAVMNGPYADIRGFFCCSSVDDVGEVWLGLTLTLSFGFVFVLFAFSVAHMLDALPLDKWYQRYVAPRQSFA